MLLNINISPYIIVFSLHLILCILVIHVPRESRTKSPTRRLCFDYEITISKKRKCCIKLNLGVGSRGVGILSALENSRPVFCLPMQKRPEVILTREILYSLHISEFRQSNHLMNEKKTTTKNTMEYTRSIYNGIC